jgi:hypothetical protein
MNPEDIRHSYARARCDVLFFGWLSGPGLQLVRSLAEDIRDGRPISPAEFQSMSNSPQRLRNSLAADDVAGNSASPVKLKRPLQADESPPALTSSPSAQKRKARAPSISLPPSIPKFYLTGSLWKREPEDTLESRLDAIRLLFAPFTELGGMSVSEFMQVTKGLCELPSTFNACLFRRIRVLTAQWAGQVQEFQIPTATPSGSRRSSTLVSGAPVRADNPADLIQEMMDKEFDHGRITMDELCEWWRREVEPFDKTERLFRLLKRPEAKYIQAKVGWLACVGRRCCSRCCRH